MHKRHSGIQQLLDAGYSRAYRDRIVDYVGNDDHRFGELMEFFFHPEWRYNQRSAWAVGVIGRRYPALLDPYWGDIQKILRNPSHDAVPRNIFRILEDIEIPESHKGWVYDTASRYLTDPSTAIAIRVFAMTVMEKIAIHYPDLREELRSIINNSMPGASAAFWNRGAKILARLKKIET